jgi:hypothetical protein
MHTFLIGDFIIDLVFHIYWASLFEFNKFKCLYVIIHIHYIMFVFFNTTIKMFGNIIVGLHHVGNLFGLVGFSSFGPVN